ncbi:MAG: hypothetical protein A4E49_02824 [Methanosaeta sp. PtaU1.Bin112]|nr:MAG: hypothetical protein A4E49_02824 [Methanosaeta sp. PtaU1.Bin112]
MRKMILLISAFCFLNLLGMTLAQSNAASANQTMTVLKQDSGTNISKMNLTLYSVGQDWGIDAFSVGEAVKFTAPTPDWKLKQIRVLGWNYFNETTLSVPSPSNFLIEVRDEKLDLLYRLADTQNAYFTLAAPGLISIDIPALPLTGDFYIIFYDRSTMKIGVELENGTGNSYQFNSMNGELIPADFNIDNQTVKVNWVIRAVGE